MKKNKEYFFMEDIIFFIKKYGTTKDKLRYLKYNWKYGYR